MNGRIPFLDMMLVRKDDQSIRTQWYMKPIASGRFLDYTSFHPLHQKVSMATSFIHRVHSLSTNLSISEIKTIVDKQLELNHYPKHLRNRLINRMNKRTAPNTTAPNDSSSEHGDQNKPQKQYCSLPHVPVLSDKISKLLKRDYPDIRIAPKNINTVRGLFTRVKDRVPAENQHNVIYTIPCSDCRASYIGMTTQQLKNRMSGHRSSLNALKKLTRDRHTNQDAIASLKEKTALVKHTAEEDHNFSLERVRILDRHKHASGLAILEACHITNTETVNKRTDTDNLSSSYAGILHTLRQKNNFIPVTTQNTHS